MVAVFVAGGATGQAPGPIRFADAIHYPGPASWFSVFPSRVVSVVRDFDGDGQADVVAYFPPIGGGPPVVRFWQGDGAGGFTFLAASQVAAAGGVGQVASADFNADGFQDLLVGLPGVYPYTANVAYGNGTGSFTPGPPVGFLTADSLATGDLDQDGDVDFVITGGGGLWGGCSAPVIQSWLNLGTGSFAVSTSPCFYWQFWSIYTSCSIVLQTELRDMDQDGLPDYVGGGAPFQIMRGLGQGCFANASAAIYWWTGGPPYGIYAGTAFAFADFDGLGGDDMVLAASSVNPPDVAVYLRASPTGPQWNLGPTFDLPQWSNGVTAGDFNLDGQMDFALTEYAVDPTGVPSASGNRLVVFQNFGGGTGFGQFPFEEGVLWNPSSPVTEDVNGDGWPDLLFPQRGMPGSDIPGFAVLVNAGGFADLETIGLPKIGRRVHLYLEGMGGLVPWVLLASAGTAPPLMFPGFTGSLLLDPASMLVLATGFFPFDGNTNVPVDIPSNPGLVGGVVHLQHVSFHVPSGTGKFSVLRSVTIQ